MPDSNPPYFQLPKPSLRHIQVPHAPKRHNYPAKKPVPSSHRSVERATHAQALIAQLESIQGQLQPEEREQVRDALPAEVDLVLTIESAPGTTLAPDEVHSLSRGSKQTISVLQFQNLLTEDHLKYTRVVLHVPFGGLRLLIEKIRTFAGDLTPKGNIRNPWIANMARIYRAAFEALWTDDDPCPTDARPRNWELWVRRFPATNVQAAIDFASAAGLRPSRDRTILPEHVILVVHGRRDQIENSIDLLNTLAELRISHPGHIEFGDLPHGEQMEWIQDALDNMSLPGDSAPSVCVLDTGIHRGHPLLSPLIGQRDNHTVFGDGDASDSERNAGHGTLMAGLAAYGDLRALLLSAQRWSQEHRIEGVKILDPANPHDPQNYGAVTRQAVTLPEIAAPTRKRVFSMAITAGESRGKPSAWSAAVDACAFGSEEEFEPKRLLLVSAGNINPLHSGSDYRYPDDCHNSPVQEPAQAWNAITVGAVTHRATIHENDPESAQMEPVAPAGEISPFSRTGITWDPHWPIKPEIVMEGGNLARRSNGEIERRDSLDLHSTSAHFSMKPVAPTRATSASTALAARLAAKIQAHYPEFWPETVRGLLIHSADWSESMLQGVDPHRRDSANRERFLTLLRKYGFGEPREPRSIFSSEQEVTLIRQDTLTPYRGNAGSAALNDCHVHELTLPKDLLLARGDVTCKLTVTLSYFVAPNPSASNRHGGSRYRYANTLLRFRVRHKNEAEEAFLAHVSSEANEESDDAETVAARTMHDSAWALGPQLRGKSGSLAHDVWQGSAADLATMDRIAVFPVKGWWATRSFPAGTPWHRCHVKSLRYSLIISVEIKADVPLYTRILNLVSVPTSAS